MIAARNLSKRVETAAGPLDILTDIGLEIQAREAVATIVPAKGVDAAALQDALDRELQGLLGRLEHEARHGREDA